MSCKGFSNSCWGYDFDWEARYAKIKANRPTVVATAIITNALFLAYKVVNIKKAKKLVISAAEFVLNDLNIIFENDCICFHIHHMINKKSLMLLLKVRES